MPIVDRLQDLLVMALGLPEDRLALCERCTFEARFKFLQAHGYWADATHGEPISACTYLTFEASGKRVTTIEGLAPGGSLDPLQEAFIHRGAAQCGFCTAGMLLTCTALLQAHPRPTREHIDRYLNGNICRCGAYVQILEAIQDVAAARRG